jgi:hypothetical protein
VDIRFPESASDLEDPIWRQDLIRKVEHLPGKKHLLNPVNGARFEPLSQIQSVNRGPY